MTYIVTNFNLPFNLTTASGQKKFNTLVREAAKRNIGWLYRAEENYLLLTNAPAGFETILSRYGNVQVL